MSFSLILAVVAVCVLFALWLDKQFVVETETTNLQETRNQ